MNLERIKEYFAKDRFAELVGIRIEEAGLGYCRASLVIEDKHLNAADVVQGGVLFTLADLAFAVAANSHGQLALAINAQISFLKSSAGGILYATATEVKEPGRLGAYDVMVCDEDGVVIVRFNGMVYRSRSKQAKAFTPED